jgi:hypothetical protein
MMEQAPQELDWVTVRAECTMRSVLKQLSDEIKIDIAMRHKYLSESQKTHGVVFSVEERTTDESVIVFREGQGLSGSVSFAIVGSAIKVIDASGATLLEATIGLNDSGRCMLRVNGSDLETWQFRKKALENLFFWY